MAFEWENDELLYLLQSELLPHESTPPSFLNFNNSLLNPPPPPPLHLTHRDYYHHPILDRNPSYGNISIDSSSPPIFPPEENFSFGEEYYPGFLPIPNEQNILCPCFDGFMPRFNPIPEFGLDFCGQNQGFVVEGNPNFQFHESFDRGNNISKPKLVSAQSRAARERRRKITEKTQELGKLVPGGSKMNTAEMLQSAFKYVKFLQAQLGILQFMNTVMEKIDVKINLDNLPLLASKVVQEKLHAQDQCLMPLDLLPIVEEQCQIVDIDVPRFE